MPVLLSAGSFPLSIWTFLLGFMLLVVRIVVTGRVFSFLCPLGMQRTLSVTVWFLLSYIFLCVSMFTSMFLSAGTPRMWCPSVLGAFFLLASLSCACTWLGSPSGWGPGSLYPSEFCISATVPLIPDVSDSFSS